MHVKTTKIGLFAFVIVLLFMPLGHTLMVLIEQLFGKHQFASAFFVGLLGLVLLYWGAVKNQQKGLATVLGLVAGVLVWTGWIEFSFVWIAHKLEVQPLIENGEISTKPEYLVMLSSLGLLSASIIMFMFSKTACQFFNWFQKILGIKKTFTQKSTANKPSAIIAFSEIIMIIWTFYLVLLLVYDEDIAGDEHPLTYLVAFGSLFWSIYLFLNLIKIQKFDYAIKYAIPTVVIFWNFVEIIGRWNLLKEIWIYPKEHGFELLIIFLLLVFFIIYSIREHKQKEK